MQIIGTLLCDFQDVSSSSDPLAVAQDRLLHVSPEQALRCQATDMADSKLQKQLAYRERVKHRILTNKLSAEQMHQDFVSAQEAGAVGAADIIGSKPGRHSKRDLLNKCLRDNEWPGLYWAEVPMANLKTGAEKMVSLPFLLPHEWLPLYCKQRGAIADLDTDDPALVETLATLGRQLQAPFLVGLGLHGDGVPIGGTLCDDSLDCFNVNMATSKKFAGVRVPFTCAQLKHIAPTTFDAIVEVFCWSMECLAVGRKPTARHDGSPWLASDAKRAISPEQACSLGIQAALVEVRADWAFFTKLLKFPAWNHGDGLCWLCKCSNKTMRTLDTASAHWRFERLLPGEFVAWCLRQNRPVSQLFSLPGVTPEIAYPDWMHSGDLGVAQDVAGHTFAEALNHLEGSSEDECCQTLWTLLQEWYVDAAIPKDRQLQKLKPSDFLRGSHWKLSCKAAQMRAMVPFLPVLCRHCMPDTEQGKAVTATCTGLALCYCLLPKAPCTELAEASRRFANSYCALWLFLEANGCDVWQVMPKLHLFQELCEYSRRNPRDFWCYADETFGGVCANLAVRRGGRDSPGHNVKTVLLSWCCQTPLPRPWA